MPEELVHLIVEETQVVVIPDPEELPFVIEAQEQGPAGVSPYQQWLAAGNVGTVDDFLASLNGKEIELRNTGTHIEWRYVGDPDWIVLIDDATLVGDDGRNPEFQVNSTHVQWRLEGDTTWLDLIPLSTITGPRGYAADMTRSSTSSVVVGSAGTKTFVFTATSDNLGWYVGMRLRASNSTNTWIEGTVTSFSPTQVSITADLSAGSGTVSSWALGVAGVRGATGSPGASVTGPAGAGYYVPLYTGWADISSGNNPSFAIGSGYAYSVGARVRVTPTNSPTDYGEGVVTYADSGGISVLIDRNPNGFTSDQYWSINIAGDVGADGMQGLEGPGYGAMLYAYLNPLDSPAFLEAWFSRLAYVPGAKVRLYSNSDPSTYVDGVVTSYEPGGGYLYVTISAIVGASSDYYWWISLIGDAGSDATVNASNVGTVLDAATAQTVLDDSDKFSFIKATGTVLSSITWANLKTALNSLYVRLTGGQTITPSAVTVKGLTIQAASGQTASLLELNRDSTTYARFNQYGGITIRDDDTVGGIGKPLLTLQNSYGTTTFYGTFFNIANINLNTTQVLALQRGGGNLSLGPWMGNPSSKLTVTANASIGANYWSVAAPTDGMIVEGRLGAGSSSPSAKVHVVSEGQSVKGFIVQGAASQLSNLIEAQNSGGTTLFYVSAAGAISGSSLSLSDVIFLVASTPNIILRSTSTDATNAGTINFSTAGGSESCTLTFDAAANIFLMQYGGVTKISYDANGAAVTGTLTASGNFTASGPSSRMPNQLALYNDSVITRQLVREEIFRMLMWSRMEIRRLNYNNAVSQGTSPSAGGSFTGFSCGTGTSVNSKASVLLDSGMSSQAGSGATWVMPNKFAFAGNAWSLLQHYTVNAYNITAGSTTFTSSLAATQLINCRVWSPYFPSGAYVVSVSGSTITMSQAATGSSALSQMVICYMGVNRFFAATAPTGANNIQRFCYETPQCDYTAQTTAGWDAGQSTVALNNALYQACTWTSGATFVTMTASNSYVVAGMHMSAPGIAAGTTVVSVSGTTVNISQPTTAAGTSINIGFYSPTLVGMALSLTGLDPTVTVTAISNTRADGLINITLSSPLPSNFPAGMEIGFRSLDTLYYRANNGLGFEYRPDPATGIVSLRIVAVRAGVQYYSSYAVFPEGASATWQSYWQWLLDYDESTKTIRLFASRQVASNSIPSVQTAPIVTLVLPSGLGGRTSGLQVALQSCGNNERAPNQSTIHSIGSHAIDYFPDRTYPY